MLEDRNAGTIVGLEAALLSIDGKHDGRWSYVVQVEVTEPYGWHYVAKGKSQACVPYVVGDMLTSHVDRIVRMRTHIRPTRPEIGIWRSVWDTAPKLPRLTPTPTPPRQNNPEKQGQLSLPWYEQVPV